jgi:hypothetical protein
MPDAHMSTLKILMLSHTPDGGVFKVGSHHYARELSKRSISVAHVSTPRSLIHRVLDRSKFQSRLSGDSATVTDVFGTIHATPSITAPIQFQSAGPSIARVVSEIGFTSADFILIDQPLMAGYVAAAKPEGRIIYRPTDTYTTWPAKRRQDYLLAVSDAVIATSSAVLERLSLRSNTPSLVLENGVELQKFMPTTEAHRSGFIYVGAVDYRFDWESVVAIAEANPSEIVTIVGPVTTRPNALPGNVVMSGAVSYNQVPTLLHRARVGLIPLNTSDVNQGRSPMKYYEYLAAGLSVLATSTQALRERTSAQTFLYAGVSEASLLSRPALAASAPNIEGMREAAAQDWAAKTELLLEFLQNI